MNELNGYQLFHEGALAFADMESRGLCIDIEYCQQQEKKINRTIQRLEKKLLESKEIKLWKKEYKDKFNLYSNQQFADILFNKLKYESVIKTEKGNYSTSEEALEKLNLPIAKDWVKANRLKNKVLSTYIKPLVTESTNGIIHPFFNLHTTVTYRSSSNAPNFQNFPKRNKEIQKIIRSAINPRKDHLLMEVDISGAEVRVAACYHNDPNMIEEINNPNRDMHRDAAIDCFKLAADEVSSLLRFCGKSFFVFAQFYGDYYVHCAENLWNAIEEMDLKTAKDVPIKIHLASKGIKTYQQFENHIKKVEEKFWNVRFPVYKKWKIDHYNLYQQKGYFDTLTGFRIQGMLQKNKIINYPIQGSAFHCLLWSLIRVNNILKKQKMDSYICGQIHDSLVLDVNPEEYEKVIRIIKKVMTKDLLKAYKWIIVPFEIDIEVSPMNESWYGTKEVKYINQHICGCKINSYYAEKYPLDSLLLECPLCGEKEAIECLDKRN